MCVCVSVYVCMCVCVYVCLCICRPLSGVICLGGGGGGGGEPTHLYVVHTCGVSTNVCIQ